MVLRHLQPLGVSLQSTSCTLALILEHLPVSHLFPHPALSQSYSALGLRDPEHVPLEATWYQSLSSQVGAASRMTGERRVAVDGSFPLWVPTAIYQPGPG